MAGFLDVLFRRPRRFLKAFCVPSPAAGSCDFGQGRTVGLIILDGSLDSEE